MSQITIVGGARIGWVNATWPLAILTVSQNNLVLNATLIGHYSFKPDQVVSIERYSAIPFLGWGIQIKHTVMTYPPKIIFWCFGNPSNLISQIDAIGFLPHASPSSIPSDRGAPVRWQAVVAIILLWNCLFLLDTKFPSRTEGEIGLFSSVAIALLFFGSVSIWRIKWLQGCILKPGRSPTEIKAWLYLLALISGIFFIVILGTYVF